MYERIRKYRKVDETHSNGNDRKKVYKCNQKYRKVDETESKGKVKKKV